MSVRRGIRRSSVNRSLPALIVVTVLAGLLHTASSVQSTFVSQSETLDYAAIDQYIEEEMADCRIPGLALGIVRGDEVLYLKGYGVADETDRPVAPQTPFMIASVSKTFTALAVMQLKEAALIDLDMPVSRYLPEESAALGPYQEMAVRQLLNHTAGLDPQAEYRVTALEGGGETISELVQGIGGLPLAHTPGAAFEYNSAGYIVLGEVIRHVSGLSFNEYLQQNIFDPLEMNHSFTAMEQAAANGLAVGYRTIFGFPRVSDLTYAPGYAPAFGIASSAGDLTHYMIALLNGGSYEESHILSENGLAEMLSPSASISPYIDYGLGWFVTSGSFYHGGELTDYQTKVKLLPEDELGVALLYNTSSSTAVTLFGVGYRDRIESGIINIVYGYSPDDQPGLNALSLSGQPMAVTYGLMLVLPVVVVLLLGWEAWRLRTLAARLERSRFRFWSILLFSVLAYVLLPVYLLLRIPREGVSWGHVLHYLPDIGWSALILSGLLLVIGVSKGAIFAVFLKDRRYPEY